MREERIFCLGRPIVDIMVEIRESHLESLGLRESQKDEISDEEVRGPIQALAGKADYFFVSSGGIETNLAVNISFLGIGVDFIGTVGNDHLGSIFMDGLMLEKSPNLNLFLTSKEGKTASILFIRAISDSGERQDIKVVNYGVSDYLPSDVSIKSILSRATIFFSSLFSTNTFETVAVWEDAVRTAKKLGKKIIIDLGGINTIPRSILKQVVGVVRECADIISTNTGECEFIQNYGKEEISSIFSKTKLILVTRRKSDCVILDKGKRIYIPFPTEKIPDESEKIFETGSTDAFCAGFIFALLKGASLEQAGEIAAGVSLTKIRYPESHLTKTSLSDCRRIICI